jgi:hypothetical protein
MQGMEIEIRPIERCLTASGTAYWETLLGWCNFPHAYFYGNWGAKVSIILPDQGI